MLRTYYEVLAGFRRAAAWAVILLFISGIAEAVGIAALLPLLSSHLDEGAGGRSEWLGLSGDGLTIAALTALVTLGICAALLRYWGERRCYELGVAVDRSLRTRMMSALLGMRWNAYMGVVVGDGVKSVLVEGDQVGTGALLFVQALGNAAIVGAFAVLALIISPVMTAAVMVFGVLSLMVYRRAGKRSQALTVSVSNKSGEIAEAATDLLSNAKFYRSTGLQDRVLAHVDAQFGEWARFVRRIRLYLPATRLAFDTAGLIFIGLVLAVTLVLFRTSLAASLVFLALFYRLTPRLQQAQQCALQAKAHASWWFTWRKQHDRALAAAEPLTGDVCLAEPPTIEFDRVSLTYPERSTPALADVSYTVAPGECVAVVGPSGSGKTTVLDLVTGLLHPSAGEIRFDGVEIAGLNIQAWRERVGLVIQDAPVFQGTILDNIAWTDREPNEERAWRVASMANLGDVIAALPDGLHTELGQRGGRLSGGQRQRIALARALYRDPWLLILDEATSALDAESEAVIQSALDSLRGSCSMLLVAHRLKTVSIADRILVLSFGRVVEHGTWDELCAAEGTFAKMLASQSAGPSARMPSSTG